MADDRQRARPEAVHLVRRVDDHDPADRVAVPGGQPQGQRAAHRQAADEDPRAPLAQRPQLAVDLGVPVLPAGELHVLPAGAVAGQQRQRDREPALGQVLGPGAQRLRGAGETVAEEDADLSAVVAERLGSGKERHRRSPVREKDGVATPGVRSPYATVLPPTRVVGASGSARRVKVCRHDTGGTRLIYGAMKFSIGGSLKLAFRPWVEGLENIPAEGAGDPREQPPVLLGLLLPPRGAGPQGHLHRQGRVLHLARA